jgi:hypothetical protein
MEPVIQLMIGHVVFLGSDSDVFERSITNFTNSSRNSLLFRGHLLRTNGRHLIMNLKVHIQFINSWIILRLAVPYK